MFNKNKNLRPLIKSDSQPKEGVQKQGTHTSFLLKHNQEVADLSHMAIWPTEAGCKYSQIKDSSSIIKGRRLAKLYRWTIYRLFHRCKQRTCKATWNSN